MPGIIINNLNADSRVEHNVDTRNEEIMKMIKNNEQKTATKKKSRNTLMEERRDR